MVRVSRVVLAGLIAGIFLALAPGVLPGGAVRADDGAAGISQERPVRPDPGTGLRPVPAPNCDTLCAQKAERLFNACLKRGGGEDRCHAAAKKARAECLTRCNVPPANSCKERCEKHAQQTRRACLAAGGGELECNAEAEAVLAKCLTQCRTAGGGGSDPAPCVERCNAHAEKVKADCEAAGGSRERCAAHARAELERCLAECRRPTPVEPPTCQERCTEHARHSYEACVTAGHHTPEECRKAANEQLEACLATCATPPKPVDPAPPTCADKCAHHARQVQHTCLAAGGSVEDCATQGAAALEECLGLCTAAGTPPEQCRLECQSAADEFYRTCIADGHDAAGCEARAHAQLEHCVAGCG